MLILGIDTSSKKGFIFIGNKEEVLISRNFSHHSTSKEILPALNDLLRNKKLKLDELKGIVISLGPGSFTGLRIGLSLAKSLSFSLKIPLIGIPTLDYLAFSVPISGIVCPVREAYGGCYYAGFFEKIKERIIKRSDYLFLSPEKIIKKTKIFSPQRVTFFSSSEISRIFLKFKSRDNLSFFQGEVQPKRALLELGLRKIKEGKVDDLDTLTPLYVSPPRVRKELKLKLKVKIRPMEKQDLIQVGEIEKLSFSLPWSVNFFSLELKKKEFAHYWVIELNEVMAGYGGYWKIKNEAHLVNLAIHPHYRRKGLGRKLLRHILEDARNNGLKIVTLEVRESNRKAQMFYEKSGFKKVAIHPHYYHDTDENAFIYLKNL